MDYAFVSKVKLYNRECVEVGGKEKNGFTIKERGRCMVCVKKTRWKYVGYWTTFGTWLFFDLRNYILIQKEELFIRWKWGKKRNFLLSLIMREKRKLFLLIIKKRYSNKE